MRPVIGVLALQGAVAPHLDHLAAAGAAPRPVRSLASLAGLSALILPGGESTAMLRLLDASALFEPLRHACARLPVWGVCAGAILLAREVRSPHQPSLGLLDLVVERNAYGRQLQSFVAPVDETPVAFIRAPRLLRLGPSVAVRARLQGDPVWVEDGRRWATTFHPELSPVVPSPWHQRFVSLARGER